MKLSLGPTPSGESFWNAASQLHKLADTAPKVSATELKVGIDDAAKSVRIGVDELDGSFAPNVDKAYEIANDVLGGINALNTKIGGDDAISQSQATVDALVGLAKLAEGAGLASHSF